jgi:hypothetical protein
VDLALTGSTCRQRILLTSSADCSLTEQQRRPFQLRPPLFCGRRIINTSRKAHKFIVLFIPQFQMNAWEALSNSKGSLVPEFRNGIAALFELIIGNSGVQMMNMVIPDIGRKPT